MKPIYIKILISISFLAIVLCFLSNPVIQNQDYHRFADSAYCCYTPNFWNVWSNFPFLVFGVLGLIATKKYLENNISQKNYFIFFIGVLLTGFGSAYYHYNPNNETLIWDRLPMTISFMSFFSIVIGVFINENWGKKTLLPLLSTGIISILAWVFTEDLRMYLMVQFLPILLLILILVFSNLNASSKKYFLAVFMFYLIAKILESYDKQLYEMLNHTISGHSLKHISASLATFVFILFIKKHHEKSIV